MYAGANMGHPLRAKDFGEDRPRTKDGDWEAARARRFNSLADGVFVSGVHGYSSDMAGLAMAIYGAPVPEPWHRFDARRRIVAFIQKAFDAARK
jgi:hypothetical protein